MKLESRFNIGDKVWVVARMGPDRFAPELVTIGKITIEHVDSKGRKGEEMFDNYKPQQSHTESYMCDETGVGSGSVWELGKNIFATKEECEDAIATRHNQGER